MLEVLQLLHAQAETIPAYCGSYYVRHLNKGEKLPDLGQQIPDSHLVQHEWIWLVYNRFTDKPLAMLVTAPAHGIVMLLRIYATKLSPRAAMVGLFRKSLAAMSNRGYSRYVCFLDEARDNEASLIDIAKRAGATSAGGKHIMVTGPTDIKW
jgi:hypothetical protein